jgi:hypothetical protein
VPPRWFIRLAWYSHRGLYRISRGRLGLWRPRGDRWGTLRLTTTGRRTGRQRSVILGHNAGRSQMAAGFLTEPAGGRSARGPVS